MARSPQHKPLRVFLNNRLVGRLTKESGGAIYFRYDESWLAYKSAIPVSLSLPLREDPYKGEAVTAVFDNLLPDSSLLRQRVSEKVGANGTDAYSLLSVIGRDCVGALQFIPDDEKVSRKPRIEGSEINDEGIERLLKNLARAPLGLDRDQDFRISIAGAQEKTALLFYNGKWLKPHGTTPTTHILKKQIGALPNGIDLSNSVENEFYCLRLLSAFHVPAPKAEIKIFGKTKTLVVERFDRSWTRDKKLLRLPQEDFCQALSCPPSRKYQDQGGPGIVSILRLLQASDSPLKDQKTFLKTQIIFWLIGATDGHAKNFSIYLGPRGTFSLAPIYDVLTAQPGVDARDIERKQIKLAMFVGKNRHYRIDEIKGRHFIQSVELAGLPKSLADAALLEVGEEFERAIEKLESELPDDFPRKIHRSVKNGIKSRSLLLNK
jgi:serine/threonine-protein kinase HipA